MTDQEKQKRRKDQNKRSEVEGKFGQAKSKYGPDDIQTRRVDTSFASNGIILLALNLLKLGKAILLSIFRYYYPLYKPRADYQTKIRLTHNWSVWLNQLET